MIRKVLSLIKENKVISGSFIMVVGGFVGSLTTYLYHLVIARSLGPSDYGILDSLISLIYQLGVPLSTISLVITKYVSSFKGQNRTTTIESFFWKINKKLFFMLPPTILIMILATPIVVNFLHLPSPFLFIWVALSFILGVFAILGKSFLQGLGRFGILTVSGIAEGIFRLLATIFLLYIGWGLAGAVFPFFLVSLFSFGLVFFLVRNLIHGEKNEPIPEKREIFNFLFPVFFTNLSITLLITSDVILVRHFLPSLEAGLYAALSTLGKIIYFAAIPVVSVIFPTISEAQAAKKNVKKVAFFGILLIGVIIGGAFIIFGFFPKLMILMLFGKDYLSIEPYVIYFAVGISLYTLNVAILNIFLALRIIFPTILAVTAAILQILLIIIFHQSLFQVLSIFILTSTLLFSSLSLYYVWSKRASI